MKIPILDMKRQIAPIRRDLDLAIKKIVDNANFVFGRQIDELEKEIAKFCNIEYAFGVSNGTDALKLSLLALGIKPGEGVLCPSFTYYASAGAIATIGAVPVFVDIDPLTYNISPSKMWETLKRNKKIKIRAVMPVHLYGQCAEIDEILKIAKKYDLKVIEDVAQAFGAQYKGKRAGVFGDCAAISFFPGKNLGAFGDAGMVITAHKRIARMLKLLRNQGNEEKYNHIVIGFNNRLDTIQAAVLQVKLKYIDSWNRKRQENAAYYNLHLRDLNLAVPFVPESNTHIYHQYVLRLKQSNLKLMEYLRAKGIDARIYYHKPLHLQKCFAYLGYRLGDFPESERASRQNLAIPVYPDLTKDELDFVISSIREFLK